MSLKAVLQAEVTGQHFAKTEDETICVILVADRCASLLKTGRREDVFFYFFFTKLEKTFITTSQSLTCLMFLRRFLFLQLFSTHSFHFLHIFLPQTWCSCCKSADITVTNMFFTSVVYGQVVVVVSFCGELHFRKTNEHYCAEILAG